MNVNPKISIIIPVYNRESLLTETLESVILQSYRDWECILVDDKSTDGTYKIMEQYHNKDSRFKIYRRPPHLKKGANSCRNFGFSQAKGTYVKWFDSDDIMLPQHLERAYLKLVEHQLDFVITDSINFNHENGEILGKPYDFEKKNAAITAQKLAWEHIGWITDDFLGRRQIVEKIKFNENIVDGDEYNFFIKMLQYPLKGRFLEEILTHRRVHSEAISSINRKNELNYFKIISEIKYHTANDLVFYNNKGLIRWFLSGYMQNTFKLALHKQQIPCFFLGFKLICNYYSISKGVAFLVAIQTAKYFKKGFNVMKYARK